MYASYVSNPDDGTAMCQTVTYTQSANRAALVKG